MKLNVIQDAPEQPWYAQGLSFSCTCSGNCCSGPPGFIWVDDQELARLAQHLGLPAEKVLQKYCKRLGQRISLKDRRNKQGNYDCIFLKEIEAEKKPGQVTHRRRVCGIYPVRPLQCRTWPFWDGNLRSKDDWEHSSRRCPGMNRGRHYTPEQIHALRTAQEWPADGPTSDAPPGSANETRD